MAPHSGTLAWKIPWAEEPGMLSTFAYTFGHLSVFSGEMSIQLLSIKKKKSDGLFAFLVLTVRICLYVLDTRRISDI